MNLEYILNNIITSGINISDPDIIRKYKVLNIFQLSIIMLAPVAGLFYFYIGAERLFLTLIVTGILMLGGMFLLRKTKNLVICGNIAVLILWVAISVISWNTGAISFEGIINPSWILNAGLILLAIFLNGYRSGTIWATVVFIETGVVIYLFRSGYQFTNMIPPEIADTYFMGTYLLCLLIILLFAFLFEKEKTDALLREREKSHTIRESKRYMDDIFDKYPLPTFVLDRNHRVIQWNRACQQISGIPTEQILGKKIWEGFHSNEKGSMADILIEDSNSIFDDFEDSIISSTDTGWFEMNTFLPRLKKGQKAIVTAAPIMDENGFIRGAIQTIQEINKVPIEGGVSDYLDETFIKPVFKVDSNGKINFWNTSCEKVFGYSAKEIIGQSPLILLNQKYRHQFKDVFIRTLKGESFNGQEWRYNSADNNPVYVLARVFPSQGNDEGEVECIVENTDITVMKMKIKKLSLYASKSNEKLKHLTEEYDLLKKNIATFIRKKDKQEKEPS